MEFTCPFANGEDALKVKCDGIIDEKWMEDVFVPQLRQYNDWGKGAFVIVFGEKALGIIYGNTAVDVRWEPGNAWDELQQIYHKIRLHPGCIEFAITDTVLRHDFGYGDLDFGRHFTFLFGSACTLVLNMEKQLP